MALKPHYFQLFKNQNIIHAFSTRSGGFSGGNFKSLNLGMSTNDNIDHVNANRNKYFSFLKLDPLKIAIPQQIHSDNISIVESPGVYKESDALITNISGVVLSIQTADCFPVFLLDKVKRVCAIVHSGWRGTNKNITGKTIEKMKSDFGCKASDLLVAIGAGIQQTNYQVDKHTAQLFEKKYLIDDGPGHYKLNVQAKIIDQLLHHNISKNQIEIDKRCTYENPKLFYSYRRDGVNSGRMMGVMRLL